MQAAHFEDETLKRRGPHGEEEVLFTAQERVNAAKRQVDVALNLNGKIMRNEFLVYDGPPLWGDRDAAKKVLSWAQARGLQPITTPKGKEPLPHEHTKRIEMVEARLNEQDAKLDKILGLLEKK